MSFVITDPEMMAAAADELQGIGAALAATNTAAAAPTTGVLPPAADSVSARAAALLDAHAQQYQALSAQAEAFQNQFVQTLIAAKNSYAEAEASNTAAMQLSSATSTTTPASPTNIALIMGGTGNPTPSSSYMLSIEQAYLAQNYPGYTLVSLKTPEQFWPITGLTSEPFGKSVQQGLAILNTQIMTQTAAGDHVVVVGYSQSATIATLEMRYLDALPVGVRPSPNLLSFVLLADPNNPLNGGILTHFIPGFGAFHVVTPLDTPYTTAIYTIQFDGIANFPQHLIDLPADLNALLGILDLHGTYPFLTTAQVATAIQEQIGNTTYYFLPTANLPLLDPLRLIPLLGNPLANLLQPVLRPIIDLGYGNVFATPGLLPGLDPLSVGSYLGQGVAHGIADPLVAGLPPVGFSAFSN
jgi:PE-PPE domain/PE family